MQRLIVFALVIGLTGCAGSTTQTTPQTVAQLQVALTAAEKAAAMYVRLPLCSERTKPICSEPQVSAQIKSLDTVAFNAVSAARQAGDDGKTAAANAAIAALVSAIPLFSN